MLPGSAASDRFVVAFCPFVVYKQVLFVDAELLHGSLPGCLRVHGWNSGWTLQLQTRSEKSEFQNHRLSMTRLFVSLFIHLFVCLIACQIKWTKSSRDGRADGHPSCWQHLLVFVSSEFCFCCFSEWSEGFSQHVEGEKLPWQAEV